jgi:hypothetical protein
MTLDQIDQMVRQANPVPDLTVLEPVDASVLVFDQQRRTEMQTHDRVEVDQEKEKSRPGFLVGIAAAVVIVVGVLVLVRPMDAPVAASPIEVATAFVEAHQSFDIDKAFSYLAADPVGLGTLAEERLLARFLEAIGTTNNSTGPCEEVSTSPEGTLVRCPYEYHMLRSDEIGLGPYGPNAYDLTVLDSKVVSVDRTGSSLTDGFSGQMWMPFADWIAIAHPDDVGIMYQDASQTGWKITEESIPVWEQRSIEYVAVVRERAEAESIATAFVDAYSAFDVDAAAAYLAADANVSRLEGGEDWHLGNRWLEAVGFKMVLDSCDVQTGSPPGTVRCLFAFHEIGSDEIGLGPFSDSTFAFRIIEGEIVSASMSWNIEEFGPQVWEPFADWVAETYPEDVTIMYTNSSQTMHRFTEESIALWEQRSREYVEAVGS